MHEVCICSPDDSLDRLAGIAAVKSRLDRDLRNPTETARCARVVIDSVKIDASERNVSTIEHRNISAANSVDESAIFPFVNPAR